MKHHPLPHLQEQFTSLTDNTTSPVSPLEGKEQRNPIRVLLEIQNDYGESAAATRKGAGNQPQMARKFRVKRECDY